MLRKARSISEMWKGSERSGGKIIAGPRVEAAEVKIPVGS
jgi:hypothetical protein